MKQTFLKKIVNISSCFSILTMLTMHSSLANSFVEDSLSAQIRELSETLIWISDNERVDYSEKNSLYKEIDQLIHVLGVVISDNEKYLEFQIQELNDVLGIIISDNEKYLEDDLALVDKEIDMLIQVLGIIIHDNEPGLFFQIRELNEVLDIIISDNEKYLDGLD